MPQLLAESSGTNNDQAIEPVRIQVSGTQSQRDDAHAGREPLNAKGSLGTSAAAAVPWARPMWVQGSAALNRVPTSWSGMHRPHRLSHFPALPSRSGPERADSRSQSVSASSQSA